MERDFMGLNSKDSVVVVKEEAVEGCKESGFSLSSGAHWPLSDGFNGSKNRQSGEIQRSFGVSRQGGTHFSMAGYPMQQNAVPISMSHPFFRAPFGNAPIKQQLAVNVIPPNASFLAGTTEPWYSSKASCAPFQLTIFYGGMVNVYDDISPEKAQAIMFLAGNGASVSTPRTQAQAQAQAQAQVAPTPSPINVQPCSAISSPLSVSSHPVGGPTNKDDGVKTVTPATKVDSPRAINSLEKVMQSAVPQARKASLARFLEKRKERVMGSGPYNKISSDCITNPGPNAIVAAGEH